MNYKIEYREKLFTSELMVVSTLYLLVCPKAARNLNTNIVSFLLKVPWPEHRFVGPRWAPTCTQMLILAPFWSLRKRTPKFSILTGGFVPDGHLYKQKI